MGKSMQHDGTRCARQWSVAANRERTCPAATLNGGYLPLREAAAWAGVSPKTMRRWFAKGLPRHQAGPHEKVLVRMTEIESFLTKQVMPPLNLCAMVEDVFQSLNTARKQGDKPC